MNLRKHATLSTVIQYKKEAIDPHFRVLPKSDFQRYIFV